MITEPLLNIIRDQQKSGVSQDTITKMLIEQGWSRIDIDQAFVAVNAPIPKPQVPVDRQQIPQSISQDQKKHHVGLVILIIIIILLIIGGIWVYFIFFATPKSVVPVITESVPTNVVVATPVVMAPVVTNTPVATTTATTTKTVVKKTVTPAVVPVVTKPAPVPAPVTVATDQNLITFDDLKPADKTGGYVAVGVIPNGYYGLTWNKPNQTFADNFNVMNGTDAISLSGYHAGIVSPKNAIYCKQGTCSIYSNTPFDLKSFYVTAAWNDKLDFQVQGHSNDGGILCNNSNGIKTINATTPQLVTLNCTGITSIDFWTNEPGSVVHPGYNHDSSGYFVIDNISLK